MRKILISIIDYGVGNQRSVLNSLRRIGFRSTISREKKELKMSDVLILPGVGTFPTAMDYLYKYDLVSFLKEAHQQNKPIIGICLGMQLLAESSTEVNFTTGLGLIPGKIESINDNKWHIGWNSLEIEEKDNLLKKNDGDSMYFNHSYSYKGPEKYIIANSRFENNNIVSAIRKGNTIGLQFHPEKSQELGLELLKRLIEKFVD